MQAGLMQKRLILPFITELAFLVMQIEPIPYTVITV